MTGEWPRESAERRAGIPLGPVTPRKRMVWGDVVLLAMTPMLKGVEGCEGFLGSQKVRENMQIVGCSGIPGLLSI
jgi:hypothetical protein